ncbi:glutamate receptor U1-like [Scylla paramamosain]|uniref:glutamate receptor U1-like n=1 Tax=Scylla paramamosain TaxID=85552 RepID=UPI00308372E7
MLLFSLESSLDASVLRDEALSGVEKLTLIGHLSVEADRGSDALGVYTVLPFCSGVRLLSPWERESFSRWEALFPDRFPSFQGYTFHIASRLKDEPFFFPSVKDPLKRNGVGLDMMECLSAKLNFSYTATNNSPDSKWGASSNGVWDGVLGMVHRREKNFTINSFLLDINRSRDFDFSTPIHIDGFGVYLRSPDPLPNWMSFAKVFQGSVWLAVLFAFLASTCFTLLRERVRERWSQSLERNRPTRGLATICLDIQRPLVAQSVPLLPAAVPLRILMALWFVYGLDNISQITEALTEAASVVSGKALERAIMPRHSSFSTIKASSFVIFLPTCIDVALYSHHHRTALSTTTITTTIRSAS